MKTLSTALRLLVVLTLLTGVGYPAVVTLLGRSFFAREAGGSLVEKDGKVVGSALLAQRFHQPDYFWPRPSAGDDGTNYATVASSASNLGPTSSNLVATTQSRVAGFAADNTLAPGESIPAEMIFDSGSGLDPEISPAAAQAQINRVAAARHYSPELKERLRQFVERAVLPPQLGFLGEPRVNVLKLNLALDRLR